MKRLLPILLMILGALASTVRAAAPTLTDLNPDVYLPVVTYLGDATTPVTLTADDGTGGFGAAAAPVAVARPSTDDALRAGNKAFQHYQAYAFDRPATAATNQSITFTFLAERAGQAILSVRAALIDGTGAAGAGTDTLVPGRYVAATYADANQMIATLNGITSSNSVMYAGDGTYLPTHAQQASASRFTFYTFFNGSSKPASFPVVKGLNTVVVKGGSSHGDGCVVEGLHVGLFRQYPTGYARPRRAVPNGPKLSYNTNAAWASIKSASASRLAVVMFVGDSFFVRSQSWAANLRQTMEGTLGAGGLVQRLASVDGSPTNGLDFAAQSTDWTSNGAVAATRSGLTGTGASLNANVVFGCNSYGWTTAQTGTMTLGFTGTQFRIVHHLNAAGGDYTVNVDSTGAVTVHTAGAANTFDKYLVTGLANGAHTVVISKTETSAADGVQLATFLSGGNTGIASLRMCRSSATAATQFPTASLTSWQSFLTAQGCDLTIYGCVNNQGTSGTGKRDDADYAVPLVAALPTLIDTTSAPFVLADHYAFYSGTINYQQTPGYYSTFAASGVNEFNLRIVDLALLGQLGRPISYISPSNLMGPQDQFGTIANLGQDGYLGCTIPFPLLTGGNWTVSSKTITLAGAFYDYNWHSGDKIYVKCTGSAFAAYTIASKTGSGAIVLSTNLNASDVSDSSVVAGLQVTDMHPSSTGVFGGMLASMDYDLLTGVISDDTRTRGGAGAIGVGLGFGFNLYQLPPRWMGDDYFLANRQHDQRRRHPRRRAA